MTATKTRSLLIIAGIGLGIMVATAAILTIIFVGPTRLANIIQPPTNNQQSDGQMTATTLATDLDIPWAIGFLPNGHLLVTERTGQLKELTTEGQLVHSNPLSQVQANGEGGLLGLAIHPQFSQNNWLYLYFTYAHQQQQTLNRVVRFDYRNGQLANQQIILEAIPGASNHNGGRLAFGPDGYLYIATGDAAEPSLAQDKASLAGKILRLTDQGQPAPNNPSQYDSAFNSAVYSYGHRNPQGLAWDSQGQLWSVEHGQSATDELNRVTAGGNYGWPVSRGDQTPVDQLYAPPFLHSGTTTWAPSGLAFWNNQFYFSGLRGQSLYQ